jgi:hypothetical protein
VAPYSGAACLPRQIGETAGTIELRIEPPMQCIQRRIGEACEHVGKAACREPREFGQQWPRHFQPLRPVARLRHPYRRDCAGHSNPGKPEAGDEAVMVEETELWDKQKSVRDLHMDAYNPERGPKPEPEPEPESWLELDEEERIFLTETYHRVARIKLPNMTAHAALHAIVENQIALNLEPVVRAMHRLRKEGLTRHDAVHAIGSVVAEHLFDLKTSKNDDAADSQTRYHAAVERLSAASWGRGEQ